MSKALILVPARFGSTRFPGKPLAKILGKSMISYVVENCQESGFDFAVVTDNQEIKEELERQGAPHVIVKDLVETGSQRIALALERFFTDKSYDYIVNLQGDEPLMQAASIQQIVQEHIDSDFDIMTGVKARRNEPEMFNNPNIVKAVYTKSSKECHYFSRAAVPYGRADEEGEWYQHIGIYSYKKSALVKFNQLDLSPLEKTESLEQLRAIESGMRLGASILNTEIIGVDRPEDIHKVEGVLGGK